VSAAVAASCSLPGLSAPVTINGRRYFDGGFASAANADLASGYAKVLVLVFTRAGPSGPRVVESVERQAQQLRRSGAEVRIIHPDEASMKAIGTDWLNFRARPDIARLAMAQGVATASEVARFIAT
jgi:NTE family protein